VNGSKIFFDTCILIDCATTGRIGDDRTRDLHHLANADNVLLTSITVVGEMVHSSFEKDTFELDEGIRLLKELKFKVLFPVQELRDWCVAVDREVDAAGCYGSSVTDRTHYAYALAASCDFYVTSKGETRTLVAPKKMGGYTEAITLDDLFYRLKLR